MCVRKRGNVCVRGCTQCFVNVCVLVWVCVRTRERTGLFYTRGVVRISHRERFLNPAFAPLLWVFVLLPSSPSLSKLPFLSCSQASCSSCDRRRRQAQLHLRNMCTCVLVKLRLGKHGWLGKLARHVKKQALCRGLAAALNISRCCWFKDESEMCCGRLNCLLMNEGDPVTGYQRFMWTQFLQDAVLPT